MVIIIIDNFDANVCLGLGVKFHVYIRRIFYVCNGVVGQAPLYVHVQRRPRIFWSNSTLCAAQRFIWTSNVKLNLLTLLN